LGSLCIYPQSTIPAFLRQLKGRPDPAPGGNGKVVVQCSNCQERLKVAATSVGKKVKCPGCGTAFVA